MPFTNRNNNSSQRAGRGLGPCGAGMSRGRNAENRQGLGRGQGAGRNQCPDRGIGRGMGQGAGMRRRDGSCRSMSGQQNMADKYTSDLEKRIADLEAENRRLKAEASK